MGGDQLRNRMRTQSMRAQMMQPSFGIPYPGSFGNPMQGGIGFANQMAQPRFSPPPASQIGTGAPMPNTGQSFVQASLGSSKGDANYDAFSDFNNDGKVTTADFGEYMQANPGGQASMVETQDSFDNRMMGQRFAQQQAMDNAYGRFTGPNNYVPIFDTPQISQIRNAISGRPSPSGQLPAWVQGRMRELAGEADSYRYGGLPAQQMSPAPQLSQPSFNSFRPQGSLSGGGSGKAGSGRSMGMAGGGLIPNYRNGGLIKGYQDGGQMMDPRMEEAPMSMPGGEMMSDSGMDNEMLMVVLEAKAALEGRHPDPEAAVERFVEIFGEDELMSLQDHVIRSMESGIDEFQSDGMSDSIPGNIDGMEEVALSEGEYVVPADVVSGLGNGDTESGARRMREMIESVRMARNGSPQQPPAVNPSMMMPS